MKGTMLRTDELARLYNQGAQRNFRNDGQLMPIIAFHGGPVELIVQLQPGAQVPVKVDPNDHSQLMIGLAG